MLELADFMYFDISMLNFNDKIKIIKNITFQKFSMNQDGKETKKKSRMKKTQDGEYEVSDSNDALKLKDIPESLFPKLNQLITNKRAFYEALS